jgi:hypothetical protein
MKVTEMIEALQKLPPDAPVGYWRSNMGEVKFWEATEVDTEVQNAKVFVGIGFGRVTDTIKVKDWK